MAATGAGGYDDYAFIADLYDYVVPYANRQDVAFFVDAAVEAGGPVLEIGCGTGRVLVPTARGGVEIVGLDASPRMLAVCRQRLAQERADVEARAALVEGDMRRFDLHRTFNLITVPFRPFQHLVTVDDQRSCLESIYRHLAPGGRLILDLFNPSLEALVGQRTGEEFGEEQEFTLPDGRRVVRRHKTANADRFNQINHVELIYYVTHPDGRQERLVHAFPMRYLFRFEVEHLLNRCGFDVDAIYSGFDKSPYGSMYPGELIVVARQSASNDRAAVVGASAALLNAVNASDLAGVLAVWREDGVMMPPHNPPVRGRPALERYFADLFSRSRLRFVFTSSQIEIAGDLAIERVEYRASVHSPDGGAIADDVGKGVHVFRRGSDGSWKLWQDIWNSDRPAPRPEAVAAAQTEGESQS